MMRAPRSGRLEHAELVAQPGELFFVSFYLVKHLPKWTSEDGQRQ